jgi:hypothetical protein
MHIKVNRRALRHPVLGALFLGFWGVAGCGTEGASSRLEADAGSSGDGGALVRPAPSSSARAAPSPSAEQAPSAPPPTNSGVLPSLREAPPVPGCVPEGGIDEPDDDFADTNCDGIDGDAESAVFVAPTGDDGAKGTRSAPVKSLNVAVGLAAQRGQSAVYACIGEYPENVEITAGVSLYGGFDCARRWKRTNDVAVIAPKDGVPLTIRDVTTPVVVERAAFRAASATKMGASSIAAIVSHSADVAFLRSELVAGNGQRGAEAAAAEWPDMPALKQAATGTDHDFPTRCQAKLECSGLALTSNEDCAFWSSPGGHDTARICPDGAETRGGFGGMGDNCGGHQKAEKGLDGMPPTSAADGSGQSGSFGANGGAGIGFGSIVNGVYVASNSGEDGDFGGPGTSGRGGDGAIGGSSNGDRVLVYEIGGGGGQGGYAGCGGPGGKGGQGGGASIALLIDTSNVLVRTSHVATGAGGDGGPGRPGLRGEPGHPGGRGGRGTNITEGNPGMPGGGGGPGGAGGPGGGGPSIGIVHVGATPKVDDVVFDLGDAGKGLTGALKASDGVRTEIYAAKEQ